MGEVPVTEQTLEAASDLATWHGGGEQRASARVSRWSPKHAVGRFESSWLPAVVADFNRLMRPARSADDIQPSRTAANRSLALLANVMSPDSVPPILVPRFAGGIQMEWHLNGVDLEIYVDADGSRSAWCEHSSGREWEAEGDGLRVTVLRKELSMLTQND